MSHFSSNLPHPPRSRGPDAGQLLVPSSPAVVSTPVAAANPLPFRAGSLVPASSHGHSVDEDPVTLVDPIEPAPQMDRGK